MKPKFSILILRDWHLFYAYIFYDYVFLLTIAIYLFIMCRIQVSIFFERNMQLVKFSLRIYTAPLTFNVCMYVLRLVWWWKFI
jgi:hypothetical protein